jgi:hypothetical protein
MNQEIRQAVAIFRGRLHVDAEQALAQAERQDREASATALREGKGISREPAQVGKARDALAAARREVEVVRLALRCRGRS